MSKIIQDTLVVYEGPSAYNGAPIVALLQRGSNNVKTGNMAQLFIMDASMHPIESNRLGNDFAVCGNCKHRGKSNPDKLSGYADGRSCYVNLIYGIGQKYKSYIQGKYRKAKNAEEVKAFLMGQSLRLGAYGDPAALPVGFIAKLQQYALFTTGYTHAHTVGDDNPMTYRHLMLSADTEEEAITAHKKGYRTFRVIPLNDAAKPILKDEIMCPSSKGIQCADCKLCGGSKTKAKSVAIVAHGIGAKYA
jgi:hypothetical protein